MTTAVLVRRLPPAANVLLGTVAVLAFSVVFGAAPEIVALLALIAVPLAVAHRVLLRWESMLAAIVVVVLFIPIKRYTLPASLPFEVEPYRVLVALVILCWVLSLVADPRLRLQRTAFDAPLLLLVAAIVASVLANPGLVREYDSFVAKSVTFFLSFLLVYYFTANAIQSRRAVDSILGLLVAGGALVAIASVVERRSGYNVFFQLADALPFLEFSGEESLTRGGRLRVYGSAQHPIAMGALFAVLIPIGVSLAYRATRLWWIPTVLLGLGAMASGSRTAIVMIVAAGLILLWLKPVEVSRLWPYALPAVVIVHFVLPGAIGTFRSAFMPQGGLIAEQTRFDEGDPLLVGGRIRLIRPSIDEWAQRPVVGQGYGTRLTGFTEPRRNAPILDDQWLGTLLDIGLVGFVAWIWIFVRAVRRLTRAARDGGDDDDWLFAGLAAAIVGFAIGMFTYDAFSFIQVTLVFWILLGISAAVLRMSADSPVDLRHEDEVLPRRVEQEDGLERRPAESTEISAGLDRARSSLERIASVLEDFQRRRALDDEDGTKPR